MMDQHTKQGKAFYNSHIQEKLMISCICQKEGIANSIGSDPYDSKPYTMCTQRGTTASNGVCVSWLISHDLVQ